MKAPGGRTTNREVIFEWALTTAASAVGAIIPVGAVVAQLMASLEARGDGDLDHSALLKLIEELSGR